MRTTPNDPPNRTSAARALAPALAGVVPLALAAFLSACTGEQGGTTKTTGGPSVQAGDTAAAAETGGTQGVEGMKGREGMHGGDGDGGTMGGMAGMTGGMGAEMQAHMQRMTGDMSREQMKAMLPTHRQMVANTLSRMNGEMRQMNMAADAGWNATVDSLRQDLVRLPELSATELRATMPAHLARVRRLGEMHQAMMQPMKR